MDDAELRRLDGKTRDIQLAVNQGSNVTLLTLCSLVYNLCEVILDLIRVLRTASK